MYPVRTPQPSPRWRGEGGTRAKPWEGEGQARCEPTWRFRLQGAAAGDVGNPLRADMFGVHLTGGDRATVTGMEGLRLAAAGHRDLAANHHDARVPVMRVVGVHLARSQAAVKHLVAFAPEIGFEIALVHDKHPNR